METCHDLARQETNTFVFGLIRCILPYFSPHLSQPPFLPQKNSPISIATNRHGFAAALRRKAHRSAEAQHTGQHLLPTPPPTPSTPPPPPPSAASPSPSTSATRAPSPSNGPTRTTSAPATPSSSSTSVLYGADWGSSTPTNTGASNPFTKTAAAATPAAVASPRQMEEEYDSLTAKKANNLAQPLVEAHVPVKIHIVKDHDMKERLCLEVERLGLSAVIMGSRGIGASRGRSKGKLGSVSDYCVQHCACPVVVVRYKQEEKAAEEREDEDNYQDADDQLK